MLCMVVKNTENLLFDLCNLNSCTAAKADSNKHRYCKDTICSAQIKRVLSNSCTLQSPLSLSSFFLQPFLFLPSSPSFSPFQLVFFLFLFFCSSSFFFTFLSSFFLCLLLHDSQRKTEELVFHLCALNTCTNAKANSNIVLCFHSSKIKLLQK